MSNESSLTGFADFLVEENVYKTHYIVFGDLKASTRRPLVGLHGGPGLSHHYMLANKDLFSRAGIPVVLYDQIGNGLSSHVPDAPLTFWTTDLFMNELDNLLKHLGIFEDFDLLGHSWGGKLLFEKKVSHSNQVFLLGMLAGEYAANRPPKGLKRLIISNSAASTALMVQGMHDLLRNFPEEALEKVKRHESEGTVNDPEYQAIAHDFQMKHICDLDPWPANLLLSFSNLAKDQTVYKAMWGPLEFSIKGNLQKWSIVDTLHRISAPTLLITAPRDEMQEVAYLPFFLKIPKVKWVDIPTSIHLPMYDDPEKYFSILESFLKQ